MKAQPVVGFWVSQLRGRQHHDHALAHNRTKDKNKQQPRERDVALHTNHHVQFKEQTKMHSKKHQQKWSSLSSVQEGRLQHNLSHFSRS